MLLRRQGLLSSLKMEIILYLLVGNGIELFLFRCSIGLLIGIIIGAIAAYRI